jgi:hypothetical protein
LLPRPTRERLLPLLLVGALLLCHGVFGALHLVCNPPVCAGAIENTAEHHPAARAEAGAHEHPAGHETDPEYFAVVASLLGLLLSLVPKGTPSRVRLGMRGPSALRWASAVVQPPLAPTLPVLQVFRL